MHREAGISQILILFQDMSLWGPGKGAFGHSRNIHDYKHLESPNLPLQEKYIRYIIARWGCYVDVWELFNEDSYAPEDYLAHLANVVRKADPYGHLVTTNYHRPRADWQDITTWHEYMGMPANEVDAYLVSQIAVYKSHGKVVQNTEFGNQGILSNVDPIKWRIATWTAFMNESSLLFWGMSGRVWTPQEKGKGNANAYIGADTRKHWRVLAEFTRDLPVDMRPMAIGYTNQRNIRTYGLSNGRLAVMYVHHFSDHETEFVLGHKLMLQTGPGMWEITWLDPQDGREVLTETMQTQQQYLQVKVPPVKVDLAMKAKRVEIQ